MQPLSPGVFSHSPVVEEKQSLNSQHLQLWKYKQNKQINSVKEWFADTIINQTPMPLTIILRKCY